MPRFRRSQRRKLAGLNVVQNKEIVDSVSIGVAAATNTIVTIAQQTNDYTGVVGECPLGSIIKGFEIMISYSRAQASSARLDWYLIKKTGNFVTLPVPGSTGGDPARRFIVHEDKGLTVDEGNGVTKSKVHINIPRRFWRMGENDKWQIAAGASSTYNLCIKAIYKWKL